MSVTQFTKFLQQNYSNNSVRYKTSPSKYFLQWICTRPHFQSWKGILWRRDFFQWIFFSGSLSWIYFSGFLQWISFIGFILADLFSGFLLADLFSGFLQWISFSGFLLAYLFSGFLQWVFFQWISLSGSLQWNSLVDFFSGFL